MTVATQPKSLSIAYKGFIIEAEKEPWALKCNDNFFFYAEGDQGASDCSRHGFATVEEAKIGIENKLYDELERLNSREKFILSLQDASVWPALIQKEWQTKLEDVRREQKEIFELIKR